MDRNSIVNARQACTTLNQATTEVFHEHKEAALKEAALRQQIDQLNDLLAHPSPVNDELASQAAYDLAYR